MNDLKTLAINSEWSVVYDPEDGNKMKEFLFLGNGYRIDQVVGTDSIVKAMFLNLLGRDHDDHHEYAIGPLTTIEVFKFAGLKNMSNSQKVMDAVEAALDRCQEAFRNVFSKDLENAGLRQALDTVKKERNASMNYAGRLKRTLNVIASGAADSSEKLAKRALLPHQGSIDIWQSFKDAINYYILSDPEDLGSHLVDGMKKAAEIVDKLQSSPSVSNHETVEALMTMARDEWLLHNDPKDGTDCVTPYDVYFYGKGVV